MKTKTSYEVRAMKFAQILVQLFAGCTTLEDFEYAINWYNNFHSNKLHWDHGVSRVAIMRADYVIKFDITPDAEWRDGRAGNCNSEQAIYERACADGFEYLLAKTTVHTIDDLTFSIMPRIDHVGDYRRDWQDYCTNEERDWLFENICDLHLYNVGYREGKVCVIDYAWDITEY